MSEEGARITLEWFGCTTFRLRVGGVTLFLDTFLDRAPSAPPVGLTTAEVTEADFLLISHAHFDHILGANVIARRTGATIVGSYESIRVMAKAGVPPNQLLAVSGGETVHCGPELNVRVFPALHSCLFASMSPDSGTVCLGELGMSAQARAAKVGGLMDILRDPSVVPQEIADYMNHPVGPSSNNDGGQLIYLIETRQGSILFSASSGCWSALLRDLHPDIALLAVAGRPNLDGEPFQGSMAEFILREVEMLRPQLVVFCHHDVFLAPVLNAHDVTAAAEAVRDRAPWAKLVDLDYGTSFSPFD